MPFPDIDPVAIQIGPIAIRWYALAYIAGLVLGWLYIRDLVSKPALWWPAGTPAPKRKAGEDGGAVGPGGQVATKLQVDDLLVWATLGVMIGGRLGHVLFYGLVLTPELYLENPLRVFYIWEGGMSFHGGLLGVIVGVILYCHRQGIDVVRIGDTVAAAVPLGIGFGRVANFINGEIWGRVTDVPWGVVFPRAEPSGVPRHPSQLYEAVLEGFLIFAVLYFLIRYRHVLIRPGWVTGFFFAFYAVGRIFVEVFYRDSNNKLGDGGWTLGIVLSIPMLFIGLWFLWYAYREKLGDPPGAKLLDRLRPGWARPGGAGEAAREKPAKAPGG